MSSHPPLVVLGVGLAALLAISATGLAESAMPFLTNLSDLHRCASRERKLVCAVRLEGVVCAANEAKGALALQDDSGAELLLLDFQGRQLQPGQRLRLQADRCEVLRRSVGFELRRVPVVDNDGMHGMGETNGHVYLKPGPQPLRVEWFNAERGRGLEVAWDGPGFARQRIPDAVLRRTTCVLGFGEINLLAGLDCCYYEGVWTVLPDFNRLDPIKTGSSIDFDLGFALHQEHAGLRFTGFLLAPREGLYTFYVRSDDGSQVFVGEPKPRLEIIGRGPAPSPQRVPIGQAFESMPECQWSVTEGTATFVSRRVDNLELELQSGPARVRVAVVDDTGLSPELLLNSRIRVSGVCQSTYAVDGWKRPAVVSVVSWREIKILEPTAGLWQAYPKVLLNKARAHAAAGAGDRIIHVAGQVQSLGPEHHFTISDGSGQALVVTTQPLPAHAGEQVEVLGKQTLSGTNLVLSGGVFRNPGDETLSDQPSSPRLTLTEQVQRLTREEAERGLPVVVRGVITCNAFSRGAVLQDATRGIYIDFEGPGGPSGPQVGEFWEIEGKTGAGLFAPMIYVQRMTQLGAGHLPEPARPTWDQLMNGSMDGQHSEIQGIIIKTDGDTATLVTHGGKIKVKFDSTSVSSELLAQHENRLVRVRGCLSAIWDSSTHQVKAGAISMGCASINVDSPAVEDPFDAPLRRAPELFLFDLQASRFQRVRVRGQVVHERAGEYFLMDGTNGFRCVMGTAGMPPEASEPMREASAGRQSRVTNAAATGLRPPATAKAGEGNLTSSVALLKIGDVVEVVGFPELGGPSPVLREAVARKVGERPLPDPVEVAPNDLVRSEYDSRLVRIEAVLVSVRAGGVWPVLELQSGLRMFVARLPRKLVPRLRPGSRLELTGVYAGEGGNPALGKDIDSFELLLNSGAGLRVVAQPAWWTLPRLAALIGALLGGLLAALVWIKQLRRKVEERTAELELQVLERERAERKAFVEAERSRIARDLHDDLGSSLTEISLLGNMGLAGATGEPSRTDCISQMVSKARESVNALDVIVWAVNPKENTLQSLADYLGGYAYDFLTASGITCRIKMPVRLPEVTLDGRTRHDVFLAVKEALNNVARHARAREVEVGLGVADGRLAVHIADNGCGFEPDASSNGNGLRNLNDRLARLGGRCTIESRPGVGTTVTLALPLALPDRNGPESSTAFVG